MVAHQAPQSTQELDSSTATEVGSHHTLQKHIECMKSKVFQEPSYHPSNSLNRNGAVPEGRSG